MSVPKIRWEDFVEGSVADRSATASPRRGGRGTVFVQRRLDRATNNQDAPPRASAHRVAAFAGCDARFPSSCPSNRSITFESDERAHRHAELAQLVGAAELGQVDDEAG